MTETAIVLVCHGSVRPETKVEFDQTAVALARAGGFAHVRSAYMELAEPSIPQALEELIGQGLRRLLVLPWFLNTGRHLAEDIPAIVNGVRRAHPGVEIRLLPHVGAHPGMVRLLVDIVGEELQALGG
jgi:sirohydrochlorin cobaltochelatase